MNEDALKVVISKLDVIIKLMSFAITQGKSQTEKIRLLSAAGFQPKEIAETIGTTPNTVRVTLTNLKKEGRKSMVQKKRGNE